VILHGLFGSGTNWRSVGHDLSALGPVYLLDARNHGRSPHTETMSYSEHASDLKTFLDSRGIQNAIVIGHSMGGKTAMYFALTNSSRIAGLVVVDISPVIYPLDDAAGNEHAALISAMLAIEVRSYSERRLLNDALAHDIPDPVLRAFINQNLVRDGAGFAWRLNLRALRDSLEELRSFPSLGRDTYQGPTLFLRGAKSNYVARTDLAKISTLFPTYKMVTIEAAGHWLHAENPAAVFKAVEPFIERLN